MDLVAIDFETANESRASACALGIARVRDGVVEEADSWLIRPPRLEFSAMNIHIHGIRPEHVIDAPDFATLWPEVRHYFEECLILAHNARFDLAVLRETLDAFGMLAPGFPYCCTLAAARSVWPEMESHALPNVCHQKGIPLRHHDPREDALACAGIAQRVCHELGSDDFVKLASRFGWIRDSADICYPLPEYSPPRKRRHWETAKAAFCKATPEKSDPAHPLFGLTIVFTGRLQRLDRAIAMHRAVQAGAKCADNVTRKTDILVTGDLPNEDRGANHQTGKARKAQQLIEKGKAIRIMTEEEFLRLLDGTA